jgi:SAM-dependent methyltransferase
MGYVVTGIDRNREALQVARREAPGATFVCLDMRDLGRVSGPFDGAAILWQSFGYFSPAENDSVLRSIAQLLRPGGRLLLDVFHAEYFRRHHGVRASVPAGVLRIEDRLEADGRLKSKIKYQDGSEDLMDFEIYSPEELTDRATRQGFELREACCWWDPGRPPDPKEPRYQLTLERPIG